MRELSIEDRREAERLRRTFFDRTHTLFRVFAIVGTAIAAAWAAFALTRDPISAAAGIAVGLVVPTVASLLPLRPASPRIALLAVPIGGIGGVVGAVVAHRIVAASFIDGLAAGAIEGGVVAAAIARRRLRDSDEFFLRRRELGWDETHPFRSFLRPIPRGRPNRALSRRRSPR